MQAVIFDMDGVLVDSERYWEEIEEGEIFPAVVDADVSASEIAGMNVRDVYRYLDAEYGTSVDEDEFVARYDAAAETVYTERAALMDGFDDVLATVRDCDSRVALASSSPRRWIRMVLDRFDLHDTFDAVVSAEELDGKSKPEPDIYLRTAERLGVEPRDCVAVEDSTHGVRAAVDAGMVAIGYRTDVNEHQDLSAADQVVGGSVELRRAVDVYCR